MTNNIQIFSITMVKNEMDIIESFIKYNLNIFDGMIILDNGSTDKTLKILKNLKNDGLPLIILEDKDREYDQAVKMNQLLLMAINEYNVDIVVPLDADEFIVSSHNGNPRKILEKIEPSSYYRVKWKTYVPNFIRDDKFIPAKITFTRDESLEKYYKVIIPKELVKTYDVRLSTGNHDLIYDPKYQNVIKPVTNEELRIAHFPIRSIEQTASKIMVGWINFLSRIERAENDGNHWQKIYNQLKQIETIQNEDVTEIAKEFALKENYPQINIQEDPMDTSFCNDLEIIYSNDKVKPISNLLESVEWRVLSDLKFKREALINEKRLKNKIYAYESSTSWRITSPLRMMRKIIKR